MINVKQFNKQNECDVQDGISPENIIYVGLIENIPSTVLDNIGVENLYKYLTTSDDSVIIYIS